MKSLVLVAVVFYLVLNSLVIAQLDSSKPDSVTSSEPVILTTPAPTICINNKVWNMFRCNDDRDGKWIQILAIVVVSCIGFFLILFGVILYLIFSRGSDTGTPEQISINDPYEDTMPKKRSQVVETGLGFYSIELNDVKNKESKQNWESQKDRSRKFQSDYDFIEKGYKMKTKNDDGSQFQQQLQTQQKKTRAETNFSEDRRVQKNGSYEINRNFKDDDDDRRQLRYNKNQQRRNDTDSEEEARVSSRYERSRYDRGSDQISDDSNNTRPHGVPRNSVPVLPRGPQKNEAVVSKHRRNDSNIGDQIDSVPKMKYYSGINSDQANQYAKPYDTNSNTRINNNNNDQSRQQRKRYEYAEQAF